MRIAFIGGHGHFMLRPGLADPSLQIDQSVAVTSDGRYPDAARAMADRLEQARWFDDPVAMLDQFRPDIVNVGAVYGRNGDMVAAAAERGIPVVCDKPIATTRQQLDRLRDLAAANDVPILTEFNARVAPPFRAAMEAVTSGAIGTLVLASAQKSYRFGKRPEWYGRRDEFGGLILWVAAHAIDFLAFCSGATYQRVVGVQGNLSRATDYPEMEDHAITLFELDGGAHAVVHADYLRPDGSATHGDDRLRLVGTTGVIEIRDQVCRLIDQDGERELTPRNPPRSMIVELLDAALRGNTTLFSTAQSLQMAEVLLCAREAADTRQWVSIPHST